jgi:hypothetical protein
MLEIKILIYSMINMRTILNFTTVMLKNNMLNMYLHSFLKMQILIVFLFFKLSIFV